MNRDNKIENIEIDDLDFDCEYPFECEELDDDYESIDSVADGLGFYIDDDNNWIPKD